MSNTKVIIISILLIFTIIAGFKNNILIKETFGQTSSISQRQKLLSEARKACSANRDKTSKEKITICAINQKKKLSIDSIIDIVLKGLKQIQKLIYIAATLYIIYAFSVSLWSKDIDWKKMLIMILSVLFITIINIAASWITGDKISLFNKGYIINCKRPNIVYKKCSSSSKGAIKVMEKDIAYISEETYKEIYKQPEEKKKTNKKRTQEKSTNERFKTNMF